MIGASLLGAVGVRARVLEVDSALQVEVAVAAVAALDEARGAVQREVLPALSSVALANTTLSDTLGISPALQAQIGVQVQAAATESRSSTDTALAHLQTVSGQAEVGHDATERIRALREAADSGGNDVQAMFDGYLSVIADLSAAQQQAVAAAGSRQLSPTAQRAVHDVQLAAGLAQAASQQMPLFLGGQLPIPGADTSRWQWLISWEDYRLASRAMRELSQPAAIQAWTAVQDVEDVTAIDSVFAAQAAAEQRSGLPDLGGAVPSTGLTAPRPAGAQPSGAQEPSGEVEPSGPSGGQQAAALSLPVAQLIDLSSRSQARDEVFADLVSTVVTQAQAAVARDRATAVGQRNSTLAGVLALVLATLTITMFRARQVSRCLQDLAGQAEQISRGQLVQVRPQGPREVQTVSTALDAAVSGLRRLQAQATAVAHGDLHDPVLEDPLPGPLGEVLHGSMTQLVRAVRQREELKDALAQQAAHDPLTGLANRARATTLITSALHRGQRTGSMTGVLFIDLDGFKTVNDSFGHAVGDRVLHTVARRLETVVRAGDVVCRLGGDEFIVVAEHLHDEATLTVLAGRVIAAVSEPFDGADTPVRIGASVGIGVSRDGRTDPDQLLGEADAAAYRAKANGRGRVEIFDEELRTQLRAHSDLERALRAALATGGLAVHYQPVVDTRDGRLTGYEALLRWNRPGQGWIPPDVFIPVAEGSRLINEVDRWVLQEATGQLARWRREGTADQHLTMAINISGRHLTESRIVDDVHTVLTEAGLPAACLIVEVTETVLVDSPAALEHLRQLRELGVQIAIDDFGTGYTSIGQLRSVPADVIKIDRSFTSSTQSAESTLVGLMIQAAHAFGLRVIAEGVEHPEQLAKLRAAGCDEIQGWVISPALTAVQATARRTMTGRLQDDPVPPADPAGWRGPP
ncbi:putative bifunctional diguanylate cyclase/phosphodiesterase [Modestobacter sp. SSW1-42]|uniref:putative bifunctional diguanylate cyclase/phosphodiesterase n=1 Tax=Modestobacter sp. SSW1-42 TaxID=596372 RepID=UPI00398859C6